MRIRSLETKVIAPVLLLIPMACMHLGDGHHSGDHHASIRQSSFQYPADERAAYHTIEKSLTRGNSMTAQEGTETQPEGEKGG